jgi:Uma2 family endonuclease
MAPATTARLTYDDYAQLPADGKRYEIIDGELFVNAAPIPRHQAIVGNIYFALRGWFDEQGGMVFVSPIDIVLGNDTVVQPDIVAIKSDRASIVREKNVQGAPNLVIEVLSDATRRFDEINKRKVYERAGVEEYWIVDPVIEVVKIYRRTATAFERVTELSTESDGNLTSPLLPGFALDLRVVFA